VKTADQLKIIVLSFLSIVVMVGVITLVSLQTSKVAASHAGGEHGGEHASAEAEHHEESVAGAETAMTEEHATSENHTEEKMAAESHESTEKSAEEAPKEEAEVAVVKGDAEAGKAVFLKAANMCSTCHAIDGVDGAVGAIGPKLNGLGDRAGKRVPGQDAVTYIKASIENPNGYVVENYAPAMPAGLNKNMSEEEYTNLVAYLVSL
jgi:cytochrome c2